MVVSTPDAVCVRSAAAAVDALYADGHRAGTHLIINRFKAQPVSKRQLLNIDQVIDSAGARLLGVVPDDVAECYVPCGDGQTSALLIARRAARIFLRIAKRIEGRRKSR